MRLFHDHGPSRTDQDKPARDALTQTGKKPNRTRLRNRNGIASSSLCFVLTGSALLDPVSPTRGNVSLSGVAFPLVVLTDLPFKLVSGNSIC